MVGKYKKGKTIENRVGANKKGKTMIQILAPFKIGLAHLSKMLWILFHQLLKLYSCFYKHGVMIADYWSCEEYQWHWISELCEFACVCCWDVRYHRENLHEFITCILILGERFTIYNWHLIVCTKVTLNVLCSTLQPCWVGMGMV